VTEASGRQELVVAHLAQDGWLDGVVRTTVRVSAALAIAALLWRPDHPRMALGVIGGALMVGLAFWAIRGVVATVTTPDESGEIRPVSRAFALVKFFTRHVILALVGYGMMVRLHLDPVGMLVGVSTVVVAAAAAVMGRGRSRGAR
jgi:hypothetical protein